jgi:hypothetical protein
MLLILHLFGSLLQHREEVRASLVSYYTSFTSISARGPLRDSTAQMDDQRRGHNKELVRATREDIRTTASRFWLCGDTACGDRNTVWEAWLPYQDSPQEGGADVTHQLPNHHYHPFRPSKF